MLKNFGQLRERYLGALRLACANTSADKTGMDGVEVYKRLATADVEAGLNVIESIEKPGAFTYTKPGIDPRDDAKRTRNTLRKILGRVVGSVPERRLAAIEKDVVTILGTEGCSFCTGPSHATKTDEVDGYAAQV